MRYGNGKSCGLHPLGRRCSPLSSHVFSKMGLLPPWLRSLNGSAVRPFSNVPSFATRPVPVREEWKDRFSLTPDDYLHGVITVINEMVRTDHSLLFTEESEHIGRLVSFGRECRHTRRLRSTVKNIRLRQRGVHRFHHGTWALPPRPKTHAVRLT
jgi:hypothetical protein